MFVISEKVLEQLRKKYPAGTRVNLIYMNDQYNKNLSSGAKGTVVMVDDIGTIHVQWDCGSSLGIAYGEDKCEIIEQEHK
ncbi:MAG: DUF4314 domain-containing protein [Clostridia bacterium]|nr:DUF4314 domain-containing protein [Clostridia bacterium]